MFDQPNTIDPRELRNACGCFATGITVVTTEVDGEAHGMTANAFMSVSLDPPLIVVSVDKRAQLHDLLPKSMRYGISILNHEQEDYSSHFAGFGPEGMEVEFIRAHNMPLIDGALAHMVAKVVEMYPGGDHTLFMAEVEYLNYAEEGDAVLYYKGQYRQMQSTSA